MRLIVLAFTLPPSAALPPPKEGSFCCALPQPTVVVSVFWLAFGLFFVFLCFYLVGVLAALGGAVLRARKRSSDRTAMAFMRRTETGGRGSVVSFVCAGGVWVCRARGRTLEEAAEGEEEGCHCGKGFTFGCGFGAVICVGVIVLEGGLTG